MLVEEVRDLAVLVISLGSHIDAVSRLEGQVLADLWNREHDLLEGSVVSHDLDLSSMSFVVFESWIGLLLTTAVDERRHQLIIEFLVVSRQLQVKQERPPIGGIW